MKRIMILGGPGSGKSTLATALGKALKIEVTYTDQVRFLPNWVERDQRSISDHMLNVQNGQRWIIDGSLSAGMMENRIQRADTFIFLDMPRWLCMLRILKRSLVSFGQVRPNMAAGCEERFEIKFIKWTWNWKYAARERTLQRMEQARPTTDIFHLHNRIEVAKFIRKVETEN